jgi:hypothetical protein
MSIIVYWIKQSASEMFPAMSQPMAREFKDTQLSEALAFAHRTRGEEGSSHVCLHSELEDCTSLPGASLVENGKTPDGEDYTWKKRR